MNSKRLVKSNKKYCLITGSGNGLGFELAKIFACNGYSLVLVDKDEERLQKSSELLKQYHDSSIIAISQDLCQKNAALTIYKSIEKLQIKPEVLINNAGFGYFGFFAESNWEKQEDLIELSVLGHTQLTRLILPDMISNKNGRILNVASLAAFMPGPLMSVYHASKAFILSFSLALSNELEGTGVKVTVLCPGMMDTGFQKTNNNESPKLKWSVGSAEKVAKICYKNMMKNKVIIIPGVMNKIAAHLPRLLPINFATFIVRKIQENNRMDSRPLN